MNPVLEKFRQAVRTLEPCRAPFWAADGHSQTVLGHLLPSAVMHEEGERIEILLEDGDRLVTHFIPSSNPQSRDVLYLFHGLGGFSHAAYMQRTARLARKHGYHVFMTNHRGCGAGRGLAFKPYHSGRSEDLSQVIRYGRTRLPNSHHVAIGFSLSGNALLLLSAGVRANLKPDAAVAVNAPINLARCAKLLRTGLSRIYDFRFIQDMRREIMGRSLVDRSLKNLKIPWRTTLEDFDDLYTAPYGNFKNRHDYYETCSAKPHLEKIDIPVVLLTAKDDPFIDVEDYLSANISPTVLLHVEESGGHMGYLKRALKGPGFERWLDYALEKFLIAGKASRS